MASERIHIGPEVVKDAIKKARLGSTKLRDFADVLQPYLVLRVRGYSISWLVKTRNRALKIGTPLAADAVSAGGRRQRSTASTDTLTLREARERAKREWSKLDGAAPEPPEARHLDLERVGRKIQGVDFGPARGLAGAYRLSLRGDVAPTTKQYYVQARRIPQKTKAMETWSEALLKAFKAAGGIYPT